MTTRAEVRAMALKILAIDTADALQIIKESSDMALVISEMEEGQRPSPPTVELVTFHAAASRNDMPGMVASCRRIAEQVEVETRDTVTK